jgi:predicted ABC-type ATPase
MAPARPNLWIVAGPNGAGKSTFYTEARIVEAGAPLWIINPDTLTTEIAERERLEWLVANGRALDRIMAWLQASIEMYKPVGFETVLSSDKYLPLIDHATALGFDIRLIYVALSSPKLHIERVRKRVAQGGHDVPEDKIVSRRLRSFDMFERIFPRAAFAQVWDNSGDQPQLMFEKRGGEVQMYLPDAIPELTKRIRAGS